MLHTITLVAGVRTKVGYGGRVLVLVDTGAASSVALRISIPEQNDEEISEASRGFKARLMAGRFADVELTAAVNATVKLIVSDNDIDFNVFDGATVTAIVSATPLPVSNDRGTPGNLLFVSGVSITDAPAVTSPDNAAVACTAVIALILAADATRRQIIFTNIGVDDVTLGAAGHTWAKRCIVLKSGDSFVEDRASNLAWYGICDAAKTASVTTKTVIA
jgi:hypothetical protein